MHYSQLKRDIISVALGGVVMIFLGIVLMCAGGVAVLLYQQNESTLLVFMGILFLVFSGHNFKTAKRAKQKLASYGQFDYIKLPPKKTKQTNGLQETDDARVIKSPTVAGIMLFLVGGLAIAASIFIWLGTGIKTKAPNITLMTFGVLFVVAGISSAISTIRNSILYKQDPAIKHELMATNALDRLTRFVETKKKDLQDEADKQTNGEKAKVYCCYCGGEKGDKDEACPCCGAK